MQCPICGTEGAYVGLRDVKCICVSCRAYDEEYSIEEQNVVLTPAPPTPVNPNDFTLRKGLHTAYGLKAINPAFYSKGTITTAMEKWKPLLPKDEALKLQEFTALMLEELEACIKRFSKNTERNP